MKTVRSLLAVLPFVYIISCSAPQTENKVEAKDPAAENVAAEAPASGNIFKLQQEASKVKWMGSNKFTPKRHEGTIQISEGTFTVENNQITGGNFIADMNTISSAGDEYTNGQERVGRLVGHLKSPDFFDVSTFPTSTFTIISVKPLEGNPEYNTEVTGNFTIKGITKSVTFPAKVTINGNDLTASAVFTIDRSQWEVKYGSETFFPDLGDKLIRNEVELSLNLVAKSS